MGRGEVIDGGNREHCVLMFTLKKQYSGKNSGYIFSSVEPNSTFSFLIWSLKRIQRCSELQLSFVLIGVQRCGSSLFFQPGGIKACRQISQL